MSAILGLLHFDGQPVAPQDLQAMQSAMADWGPDGGGLWWEGPVGLGHLLLHNSPEARFETMPLDSAANGLVLTAGVRLDNRDELCDALGVAHAERATTPDGQLVLRAYVRWGQSCVDHLLGDWAFAAWDQHHRTLFLARDQYGNTALYYFRGPHYLAFASSIQGLLALHATPRRLNELRLAQQLVLWFEEGASTLYQDVFRLPPAHSLTLSASGIQVQRYWRMEDAPAVRLGSDGAYVEAFRELFAQAVRCRLRSCRPIGTTLSAGLDSGSVTALAARELRAQGQTLTAFTAVPAYNVDRFSARGLPDEWPLASATAEGLGNVQHLPVRAEALSPIAALRRSLQVHHQPEHAAANAYWLYALLGQAQQHGLGVLLTGQCGNGGISWSGGRYALYHLLRQGQWLAAWHELAARRDPWRAVAGQVLASPLRMLRAQIARLLPARGAPWASYAPINDAFARRLDLRRRMRASGGLAASRTYLQPAAERLAALLPSMNPVGTLWHESGAAYGLEVRDPTMDIRLLQFCLGVPAEQYLHHGQSRWLLRRAMEGLLPPQVQWNTRRGVQAADLGQRLLATRDEVEALLAQLERSSAVAYLDLAAMRRTWAALQHEVTSANASQVGTLLVRGLLIGLFLLDNNMDC